MGINDNLKKIADNKKIYVIALAAVIVLQVMFASYYFVFEKEGFHSDEVWSYGLANSLFEPYVFGYSGDLAKVEKCHQWVDGKDFSDYLTVQKGERFRYDSVWYNQTIDMHPPLYFTLLHTISSFFPDTFSRWFGYVINIAAMIIGQISLARLGFTATKSKGFSLLLCALWGFSCGFVNVNVFVRMYSLLTMFGILLLYNHFRLYYDEGSVRSNLIKIGIFSFCGALTHHYFLVAAFAIAACFCFYYLFKKQFKKLIAYALTMLGSIGLSCAAFPGTIYHLFFREGTAERLANKMPFINGFRSCIAIVLNSVSGFYISTYSTGVYAYFVIGLVAIAAICIPLGFLFRREEWFRNIKTKAVEGIKSCARNFDWLLFFVFISVVFLMTVVSLNVNINNMALHTDRYLFIIMPWAAYLILRAAMYIFNWIKPLKKYALPIMSVLTVGLIVNSNLLCGKQYLFEEDIMGESSLEETCTENSQYVICANYEWIITCFTDKLMNSDKVYPTTVYKYLDDKDEIAQMDMSKDCYVLIDSSQLKRWEIFVDDNTDNKVTVGNATYNVDPEIYEDSKSEEDVIKDFEEMIFPGYRLQFHSAQRIMGEIMHTFRVVPENEYVDVPIIDVDIIAEQKKAAQKQDQKQD